MGFCSWIFFGFFAGLVARALFPGRQKMGLLFTTLLGVAGAFTGGFVASLLAGTSGNELHPAGFVGAVLGAILLLFVRRLLFGRER